MKNRNLGVGVAVLAVSLLLLVAAGSAQAAEKQPPSLCVVHSLPSFVAQGEGPIAATVADIIEVECNPYVFGTGSKVTITASQLFSRCNKKLKWFVANDFAKNEFKQEEEGIGVNVQLDAAGNATVAALAGPLCAAGESLITVHLTEKPFESFTTSFTVLPPHDTPPGVVALPSSQVEDGGSSAVATIIEAEFAGASEELIRIASPELFARCQKPPHLRWFLMNGTEAEVENAKKEKVPAKSEVTGIELDNNGNAFVIVFGDHSCAEGSSLIEADLESKPFTTYTTHFIVEGPRPTV
jgi:hypothetical protein